MICVSLPMLCLTPTLEVIHLTSSFLTLADSDGIFQLGNGIVTGAQAVIDSSIRVSDFGAGTFALGQDVRVQKIEPQARYAEPHVPQVPRIFPLC